LNPVSLLLPQGLRWENFEEYTIELSEEEKEYALRVALEKKIAEIKEILWNEKVCRKKEVRKLDPVQLLHIASNMICNDAGINIGDFIQQQAEFEIYQILAEYFSDAEYPIYDLSKGILLHGNIGCGKTSAMNAFRMIANKTFPLISTTRIANEYQKDGMEAVEKYMNLSVVCFDDLGIEPTSKHYGDAKNVMGDIILGRYERRLKTHFTTNLTADMIESYYGSRVRSRLREMVNLIEFPAGSKDKRK
jgi:DNA replication protein DnaC